MVDRPQLFKDREDAGRRLVLKLSNYRNKEVVVFAIPSGGIPVAMEVAISLKSALDILIVRKIPIPYEPEAGYGAVTEDGSLVLNNSLVNSLGLTQPEIERQARVIRTEIIRRSKLFRQILPLISVKGKTAIIVDDGLASGYTMLAAIQSLKHRKATGITVAVPVASGSAYDLILPEVDNLICLIVPRTNYFAVASFYQNWHDLNDVEVINLLETWRLHSSTRTK
jgi:putative phosphoribosyl transferase